MTPDQERRANEAANMILTELRAATTPAECAAVGEKNDKVFARLQAVHPVRAIHIVNLASMKKREFENGIATVSARRPRQDMAAHQNQRRDLFD